MKKRLVLCSDRYGFGTKNFYLCETEEQALATAERCRKNYCCVIIIEVPDDLQI